MHRHPEQSTNTTGTVHALRKVQAPDVGADQGVVVGIQIHYVPTKQHWVADELQILSDLLTAGAAVGGNLTNPAAHHIVLPFNPTPGALRRVRLTLNLHQPVLSIPRIFTPPITCHVALGIAPKYLGRLRRKTLPPSDRCFTCCHHHHCCNNATVPLCSLTSPDNARRYDTPPYRLCTCWLSLPNHRSSFHVKDRHTD